MLFRHLVAFLWGAALWTVLAQCAHGQSAQQSQKMRFQRSNTHSYTRSVSEQAHITAASHVSVLFQYNFILFLYLTEILGFSTHTYILALAG